MASILGVYAVSPVYAAASMYVSPSSKTINVGDTLSVAVRVNSGTVQINAVQANLAYSADKLEFLAIDLSGTAFEQQYQNQGGSGVVKLARATTSPVSGDNLVAIVRFKAKAAGTATFSFTSGSSIVRSSDNKEETTTKAGGTYTIKSPGGDDGGGGDAGGDSSADTSKSTTGSSGTTSSTGPSSASSGSTRTAKKDTAAPKISGIRVSGIELEKATISWLTNEKATSVVEYGNVKKLGFIKFDTKLKTSHKISLPANILAPGTRIYYKVRSKDAAGNIASSKLTSFKTKGYAVKLRITNLNGEPLEGATITLVPGFEKGVADKNGIVVFTDVASGKHSVNIEVDGQVLSSTITVEEPKKPDQIQDFDVKVAAATADGDDLLGINPIILYSLIGVFVAVLVAWLSRNFILARRLAREESFGGEDLGSVDQPPTQDIVSPPTQAPPQAPPVQQTGEPKPLMPRNEPKMDVVRREEGSEQQ
ncbi:MAG: hypothetical protein WD187_00295 [Candidatus Woykebacteria bacterium]